ncbi:MAG: UbiA family prenyltransferase [Rhodobacteraceae bacterium]|nr:UbiA family prenyltransferase [Paracoccaceae bacterium]
MPPSQGKDRLNRVDPQPETSETSAKTEPDALIVALEGGLIPNALADELYWAARAGRIAALTETRDLPEVDGEVGLLDPASLPLNARVMALLKDAREDGKTTLLSSRAYPDLAARVAEHAGVFDGVLTDDSDTPLAEQAKGDFGVTSYLYLGPRAGDGLWQGAAHVITANAPAGQRGVANAHPGGATHIGAAGDTGREMLRAMRPHQWLKNLLIFLPVLAAHQLDVATLTIAVLAFLSFCLVASSVYLLNDLLDLAADRAHPRKRLRPFASGNLPLRYGRNLLLALLVGGLALGIFAGPAFVLVLLIYYAATLAYSFALKKRAVLDICVLAGLYTLRIVAGGVATGIELSVWLLAFSVFLFLSLAAMKRQAELVDNMSNGKAVADGRGYRVEDLPLVSQMAMSSGYVSVLVMALYLSSPEVQLLYSLPAALWGICLVLLYWISRAVFKTHRGEMNDDPIVFALKDGVSRLSLLAVIGFGLIATYSG